MLRIRTSAVTPSVTVVNDLPLETYLRGVVPAEMSSAWPTAALEAQTIASRSYAATHLRPGVSYYDVVDTSAAQVYRGAKGERATTNAIIRATRRARPPAQRFDRQHALPLGRRRRDREQRERLHVGHRGQGRRRRSATCAARSTEGPTARPTTPVRRTRPGRRDLHDRAAVGLVRGRRADERRDAHGARPARRRGVSGRLISVTPDRDGGHEDGVGRRLPVGLQRRPPERRPDAPQHAVRDRADPLTGAILGR